MFLAFNSPNLSAFVRKFSIFSQTCKIKQDSGFAMFLYTGHLCLASFKHLNKMQIQNCVIDDVNVIFNLYEEARLLQTSRNMVVWPFFDKQFLKNEISNKQQWKILIDNSRKPACPQLRRPGNRGVLFWQ